MHCERTINSAFLKAFFAGHKRLLKITQINFITKTYGFKELSSKALLQQFPQPQMAFQYLPEYSDPAKIDKGYLMNVLLLGAEHHHYETHRKPDQTIAH